MHFGAEQPIPRTAVELLLLYWAHLIDRETLSLMHLVLQSRLSLYRAGGDI